MSLPSQNERTLKMLARFMQLHQAGRSIKEIAYQFDLDTSTVYRKLDDVVARYNYLHPDSPITRESLLERPHNPHTRYDRLFQPVLPIDLDNFHVNFTSTIANINSLLEAIETEILTQELFAQSY